MPFDYAQFVSDDLVYVFDSKATKYQANGTEAKSVLIYCKMVAAFWKPIDNFQLKFSLIFFFKEEMERACMPLFVVR